MSTSTAASTTAPPRRVLPEDLRHDSPITTINAFLEYTIWQVRQQFPDAADRPYIHPRLIRFPDSGSRADWASTLGSEEIELAGDFTEFFVRPRNDVGQSRANSNVWLGLVASWSKGWVGRPSAEWVEDWHAWVFVLVRNPARGSGKHLLIWDCDAQVQQQLGPTAGRQRPMDVLLGVQLRLYQHVRQTSGPGRHQNQNINHRVWAGTDASQGGRNLCLRYSAQFLRSIALHVDACDAWSATPGDEDSPDPRFLGFSRFQRQ